MTLLFCIFSSRGEGRNAVQRAGKKKEKQEKKNRKGEFKRGKLTEASSRVWIEGERDLLSEKCEHVNKREK